MNKTFLTLTLSLVISTGLQAMAPVIERYQPGRDRDAVMKIVHDNYAYLDYESLGYPAGTTEKYFTSVKYITDVLRVGDKTVGFINYAAFDFTILTFNFGRSGIIHLIGVDKDHQRKGYGTLLFQRAVAQLKELNTPSIMICLKRDNTNALALYKKEGFTYMVPGLETATTPDIFLTLAVDVPADKLPKGNIIQQYPKTVLAFTATMISGLLYLKFKQ